VEPEEQVRPVGQRDPPGGGDPLPLEVVQLLEQPWQVDDDAVADDAGRPLVEDARGDEVELVLLSRVVVDGVSGVGAALEEGEEVEKGRNSFSW